MDELPDDAINSIIQRLDDVRDVLTLQRVNRRLAVLARGPRLWNALLRKDFDLRFEEAAGVAWQDMYRTVAHAPDQWLRFKGLSTDGGCDDNRGEFWVDNMYKLTDFNSYCTTSSANVHCMGVLLDEEVDEEMVREEEHRRYLIQHCRGAMALVAPVFDPEEGVPHLHPLQQQQQQQQQQQGGQQQPQGAQQQQQQPVVWQAHPVMWQQVVPPPPGAVVCMDTWSTPELEYFLLHLWQEFEQDHALGAVLFEHPPEATQLEEMRSVVERLRRHHSMQGRGVVAGPRGTHQLVDGQLLQQLGRSRADVVGVVRELRVSRAGEFSCPLQCGAVFVANATREQCVALARSPAIHLASLSRMACGHPLAAFDDLTSREAVLQEARVGCLPPIVEQTWSDSADWLEFDPAWQPPQPPPGISSCGDCSNNTGVESGQGDGNGGGGRSAGSSGGPSIACSPGAWEGRDGPLAGLVLRPVAWFGFVSRAEHRRRQRAWGRAKFRSQLGLKMHQPQQQQQLPPPQIGPSSSSGNIGGDRSAEQAAAAAAAAAAVRGSGADNEREEEEEEEGGEQQEEEMGEEEEEEEGGGYEDGGEEDEDEEDEVPTFERSNGDAESFELRGRQAALAAGLMASQPPPNEEEDSEEEDSEEEDFLQAMDGGPPWLHGRGTEDRNMLAMVLRRCHAGNVLLVKLVSPEDQMQLWHDPHGRPNIDVSYAVAMGAKVDLPSDVRLAKN